VARVRTQLELSRVRRAAEAANRAKDEFLAMLSHELRNPLAPILTALQLMALRGDRGAERERAIIERQVKHVVRLVDDLLDVSRIARGKIELHRERLELSTVVARAVEMVSPIFEQKQHQLVMQVPPSGLVVDADPTRLQQVIFNLLYNAAKYTEARGTITVTASRSGETITIRVADTGIGVDAAMIDRIFDLFAQEGQALDRSMGGLGLGLTIVRNLVELHGGTVSVTSAGRGAGSEFTVVLPAAGDAALAGEPEPPQPSAAPSNGVRVLIVDDNHDAAALLASALQMAGFAAREAADGSEALRLVEVMAPDAVLLDLGLPGMDGFEIAGRLRALPRPPRLLLAISGYSSDSTRDRSGAAGFDAHLVKPVDLEDLMERLRALVP
jgi:CheY-like chemotaxis protein/two-component sensor histidine kinase